MKYPYDTSTVPPAPFLPVRRTNVTGSSAPLQIVAKVDSGADITAIPVGLISQLDLVPNGEVIVEGYDGRLSIVYRYDLNVRVADLDVAGLAVITFTEDYVLLGCDVLNQLHLVLNGPALSLEILSTQATQGHEI